MRGVYARNEVYAGVRGWESFEPWLAHIEKMDEGMIWQSAGAIPPGWYESDWGALESLVRSLLERRSIVRQLITAFRLSARQPFPNWRDN